ncbi:MAG TPA: hypothetical protein DEA08_24860, partial [Planctomycetes bacterium]|nr:hypothetical protein [Planctomycetota bacterium]
MLRQRINAVADLLLAAAHADRHMEAEEIDRIEELLGKLCAPEGSAGPVPLPAELRAHMEAFRPDAFDMDEAVGPFLTEPSSTKRRVLEMAFSVHESDGELDFLEDTFIRELGFKLGLQEDEYQDLCLEFLGDDEEDEDESGAAPVDLSDREPPPEEEEETPTISAPGVTDSGSESDTVIAGTRVSPALATAADPEATHAAGTPESHEWSFDEVSTGNAQPVLERAEEAQRRSEEEEDARREAELKALAEAAEAERAKAEAEAEAAQAEAEAAQAAKAEAAAK